MQASAAALSAGVASSASSTERTISTGRGGIKFALIQTPGNTLHQKLSKQIGINHAIVSVNSVLSKVPRSDYPQALAKVKAEYDAAGIRIAGVESHPVAAEKIKLGVAGRDEEIENYIAAIAALRGIGVDVLCYNFMAGLGWYRTSVTKVHRGALVSEFDNEVAKKQGLTEWGAISEEKVWDNIKYFLKAVIPAAEKHGVKMALHPDDPPLSPLRGIGRIVTSAANYRKIMNLVPSPMNGVTFCQANFVAMGEKLEPLVREWCAQKKIFFVHFRDIKGTRERFQETFHDDGATDMARMLKVYSECGFDGPMRPDHAPTLANETNDRPGYAINAKLFALGYMKGIMEGAGLPYE